MVAGGRAPDSLELGKRLTGLMCRLLPPVEGLLLLGSSSRGKIKDEGPLTCTKVLKFVPLVSSPSGQTTREYLSRGPRKGRHWAYILLPSPGPRKCQPQTRKGRNHLACNPRLRQWTAYTCVPLDQTALHRPVATLEVSCYWFPQPLVGSTYPRDHVKVARGLSILCPTPG